MARSPASMSQQLWMSLLAVSAAMLALLGWSFLHLEPGTSSYAIGQVSAIIVGTTLVGSLLALLSGWKPF
ncbi:hypothetical protein [Saliphagus infecundisoli]|uniref:Uncharacterized protein n=1 Tax=Saliphagus infecundisoli TaxID=1849069 RepID=A0ABD5QKW4_9EURY|nr:hypothetical protein [Saliphagus infecundisoli]